MRLTVLSLLVIFTLLPGCKSAPKPVVLEVEVPPDPPILPEDENKIINEVIDHILTLVTRELKNSRDDMQICIDNEMYLYRVKSGNSHETDLKNAEQFLKSEMSIDDDMIVSFINRNTQRRNFDKDAKFKADFFWKGGKPKKNYFKINFSSIGFDKSREKAIVYICVDLPGWIFTEFVFLEKTNEDWKYINSKLH